MNDFVTSPERPKRHLLSLPAEIRILIYKAVFDNEVCEIRRTPIPVWCPVDNCWRMARRQFMADQNNRNSWDGLCTHPGCQSTQGQAISRDIYVGHGPLIASGHYPCPLSLQRNPSLSLGFLRTCRQVYEEARELPYRQTTFFTQELATFANFTYCLKTWQVASISHLQIRIPLVQSVETHLPEWNETFSLLSLAFCGLSSISVEIYFRYAEQTWRDTFWDGGLLELDRLNLKGMRLAIYQGETNPQSFFDYSAGTLESKPENQTTSLPNPISFHHARDTLRQRDRSRIDPNDTGRIFFRLSPNDFPLYVCNLIHLLPQRNRTDAEIRRQDRRQREYIYHYAYAEDDSDHSYPIFGFQFNDNLKANKEEIARGLEKLQRSRQRLQQQRAGSPLPFRPSRRGVYPQSRRNSLDYQPDNSDAWEDAERPGDWRRRLVQEAFAPFMESFPFSATTKYPGPPSTCLNCPREGNLTQQSSGIDIEK
ncbi:hypothetical protein BO94DRAFT_553946 [Aspergillus sclerotioniger CBS 115572]|uniref:DUF7730 domain-containing protein n=1 Tax=Aspergillus sclerotioniger CBS 115572 TaxID=1450535 RepID=A0A317X7F2_9EURO|nr:hypothetical protein BO94DRAFT_553946 [Aspergillus sclerotioniger CBS 115572]PWY94121.1 hypothetical protein BO94DRAFT_553946 [Aspergillus sclerotioniger CBS 115572]